MNAADQIDAAGAMAQTGYSWYRPCSDGSGNVKRLERIPWPSAIVLISRGASLGWILAKDAERADPRQLVLLPNSREGD